MASTQAEEMCFLRRNEIVCHERGGTALGANLPFSSSPESEATLMSVKKLHLCHPANRVSIPAQHESPRALFAIPELKVL